MAAAFEEAELLHAREVAEMRRVSARTLERERATGSGPPFIRVGPRQVRYQRAALLAWLAARTVQPRSAAA